MKFKTNLLLIIIITILIILTSCADTAGSGWGSNSKLIAIYVSEGELYPKFNKDITEYILAVESNIGEVTIIPQLVDPTASFLMKKETDFLFNTVVLTTGDNIVDIEIISGNGAETSTYQVVVNRERPLGGQLSTISLSEGTLNPAFDPDVLSYSAEVDTYTESLTVTPQMSQLGATYKIKIDGVETSNPVPLEFGLTTLDVEVTSLDQQTTQTYSIETGRGINHNLTDLTISGITINDQAYIISGPGYTLERSMGYHPSGNPDYQPGLSTAHDLIFEMSGVDAATMKTEFDTYNADPVAYGKKTGTVEIPTPPTAPTDYYPAMTWSFIDLEPVAYNSGLSGRTRFTWRHKMGPNTVQVWTNGADHYGYISAVENWETDRFLEIDGIETHGAVTPEIDEENNTITLILDYSEVSSLDEWMLMAVDQTNQNRAMSIIHRDIYMTEFSRRNYFETFPLSFEHLTGYQLASYGKVKVVISYDWWEDA